MQDVRKCCPLIDTYSEPGWCDITRCKTTNKRMCSRQLQVISLVEGICGAVERIYQSYLEVVCSTGCEMMEECFLAESSFCDYTPVDRVQAIRGHRDTRAGGDIGQIGQQACNMTDVVSASTRGGSGHTDRSDDSIMSP